MKKRQGYLSLINFFVLSPKMASIFSLHVRIFYKFEKKKFFQNITFFFKNYACGINFFLIDTCLGIKT